MTDLLAVYDCQSCGRVLEDEVEVIEDIDCENDRVEAFLQCQKCRSTMVTPRTINGSPCFEEVDHERWLWATGFYDDVISGEEGT